ncbi:MAG: GntR family transcriptional regulator [Planctomycetales bacterium]|nr:GntR family transcriptional regulator [Planctomycetales bacterium]
MLIRLSESDGVPFYRQIVNQVKYLVASGRLAPGEQLPSVRALAEQLTVNPNTVARAYRDLDSAGVLATRQGAGVFVAQNGSPLAAREKQRLLQERVDQLLAEASSLGVEAETIVAMIRSRQRRLT